MKQTLVKLFFGAVALFIATTPTHAVTDQDALISQTASTLASVDFAREKCKRVRIDEEKLASLVKRTGKTLEQLRKDEDYEDQANALKGVEQNQGAAMVCGVLSMSHGGYGRGVLN
jgi:hypothetical protein